MSELILYHAPGACARVSLNALEECELDYELRMLNMAKGEQKSASHLSDIRYTDGETDGIRAKGIEYFSDVMAIVDKRLSDSQWWYGQAHRETAAVDAAGFELPRGFTLD